MLGKIAKIFLVLNAAIITTTIIRAQIHKSSDLNCDFSRACRWRNWTFGMPESIGWRVRNDDERPMLDDRFPMSDGGRNGSRLFVLFSNQKFVTIFAFIVSSFRTRIHAHRRTERKRTSRDLAHLRRGRLSVGRSKTQILALFHGSECDARSLHSIPSWNFGHDSHSLLSANFECTRAKVDICGGGASANVQTDGSKTLSSFY